MIELKRMPRRRRRFNGRLCWWPLVVAGFAGCLVLWFRGLAFQLSDMVFACALLGLLAWTARSHPRVRHD